MIALGFGVVAPALPQYARSFGVSVTAATAVVSSFAAFRLVFAPAAGALVQRLGERGVYMSGLLIVALSTGCCAFVHDYWQLLVFRSLGGVGSTMFTVSAAALLVRIAPEEIRGRAQGLYGSSFLLGMVAGPVLGSAVVGLSLSAPFIIYAAALVAVAVLVHFGLRRSTLLEVADEHHGAPVTLKSALHHRTFLAALMSNFSAGWAIFGIRGALLPLFVIEALHQRPGAAGLVFAAFAAGDVSTAFLAGSWSDDIGRKPLVVAGLVVCGSTVVAMGFTSSLPALIVRVDLDRGRVHVRSLAAETPPDRSLELWYIQAGTAPRSLGLITDATETLTVPSDLRSDAPDATLAVTVEPKGGAPGGKATGPVIYSGRLIHE